LRETIRYAKMVTDKGILVRLDEAALQSSCVRLATSRPPIFYPVAKPKM
jgi:hypothetical protein